MKNTRFGLLKGSEEDPIIASRRLIETLFSVVKDCPSCVAKLTNKERIVLENDT